MFFKPHLLLRLKPRSLKWDLGSVLTHLILALCCSVKLTAFRSLLTVQTRHADTRSVCSIPEPVACGLLSKQKIPEFSPTGFGKAIQHIHLVRTRANYSDGMAKYTTNDGIQQVAAVSPSVHTSKRQRHPKIRLQQKATFQLTFNYIQMRSDTITH